jgi:3-oxoacyl-[acyl-carrier-protein] synthase III
MRLTRPLPIAAAVTWLPAERATVQEAVAAGRIDSDYAERNAFVELPVSQELHAPEMAAAAASAALAVADWRPEELDLIFHAWTHHQGHDFWSPAHFVARRIEAHAAVPIGIQQMCNGGAVALELAAAYVQGDPATQRALITTADRFAAPAFDRWSGDYGIAYGDGATGMLVGGDESRPSGLELLAIATVAEAELEAMHRGEEPFGQSTGGPGPHDVRRRKKAFMAANGSERFATAAARGARTVVERALSDADVAPHEVACVALPRLGSSILETAYAPALAVLDRAVPMSLAGRTGHLGAGDLAANLADIIGEQRLEPGAVAAVLGAGGGFSWTCAVVRAT